MAIEAMRDRLAEDSMFASAIGKPPVTVELPDARLNTGECLMLTGDAAELTFTLRSGDQVEFSIYPGWTILAALNSRDLRYPQMVPVIGDMEHLDRFMVLVEEHIAEFIAEVALSSAAHLLGPRPNVGF
jgi:hypothetical protein